MMPKVSVSRFSIEKSGHLLTKTTREILFWAVFNIGKNVSQPAREALRLVKKSMQNKHRY